MLSHRSALVNAERVWKKILKFVDKNPITGQLGTSLKKWLSIQGSCKTLLQFLPRMQNKWPIFGGREGDILHVWGAGAVDPESKPFLQIMLTAPPFQFFGQSWDFVPDSLKEKSIV